MLFKRDVELIVKLSFLLYIWIKDLLCAEYYARYFRSHLFSERGYMCQCYRHLQMRKMTLRKVRPKVTQRENQGVGSRSDGICAWVSMKKRKNMKGVVITGQNPAKRKELWDNERLQGKLSSNPSTLILLASYALGQLVAAKSMFLMILMERGYLKMEGCYWPFQRTAIFI